MKASLQFLLTVSALCATGFAHTPPASKAQPGENAKAASAQEKKTPAQLRAEKIIIPTADFREMTVPEALEFVVRQSRQHDPKGKGVNIISMLESLPAHKDPAAPGKAPPDTSIVLGPELQYVPVSELLTYIANLANLTIRWDEYAAFVSIAAKEGADGKGEPGAHAASPRPQIKNNAGKTGEQQLKRYSNQPILPKVELRDSTLRSVVEFVVLKNKQLDKTGVGFGIVLNLDDEGGAPAPVPGSDPIPPAGRPITSETTITFTANNIPSLEVLRYAAELSRYEFSIDRRGNFRIARSAEELPVEAEKKTAAQLRAEKIIIQKVDLREVTIREALDNLAQKSRQYDPKGKGINIVAKLGTASTRENPEAPKLPPAPGDGATPNAVLLEPRLTLKLSKVPASEVLLYIANLMDLRLRWDEHAAFVCHPAEAGGEANAAPHSPVMNNAGEAGEKLLAKMAKVRLPRVDFRECTVRAAIEFLVLKSKQLDPEDAPGVGRVLTIDNEQESDVPPPSIPGLELNPAQQPAVPLPPPAPGGIGPNAPITLRLTDVPLLEVMRYIANLADLEILIEPGAELRFIPAAKKSAALARAEKIKIPKVTLNEVTIRDALDYVVNKSREHGSKGKGMNVAAALETWPAEKGPEPKLTLTLSDVPASEVLLYIANLMDLRLRWDEHAAFLCAASAPPADAQAPVAPPRPRPEVKNNAGEAGAGLLKRYAAQANVPNVEFKETSLRSAIEFFIQKHGQLTKGDLAMNLSLKLDGPDEPPSNSNPATVAYRGDRKLTILAADLPLFELLRYIAEMGGCELVAENEPLFHIVLRPAPSK